MSLIDRFGRWRRHRMLARVTAQQQQRMFAAARPSRLTNGWTSVTSSADMESVSSLGPLRNRARALVRDNPHAKRARAVVVNNVIGTGIGIQSQVTNSRGRLLDDVNSAIEDAWDEWCKPGNCHVGGSLHFADIERLLLGETFEAGDVFVRLHRRGPQVPLSLEIIESERLADDHEIRPENGNIVRQGVEVDEFYRPVAYWIKAWHPGELMLPAVTQRIERVPAEQILHLKQTDRWPQVRGVPWMHAAMQRLNQLGEFQDAAVVAARIGAEKVMVLKENEDGRLADQLGEEENDGTLTWNSSKGQVDILPSGTDIVNWAAPYPDANFDPFVRAALRDVAAGFGVSYESLTRDYSQSNYSSSRLALLDDRDGWRVLQQWYIRIVRQPLYEQWLQAALLAGAIPRVSLEQYALSRRKYEAIKYKPRGWSWVDPTREVAAYKEAEKAGYITKADVIAQTAGGADIEDFIQARRRELDLLEQHGITTDTAPTAAPAPRDSPGADPSEGVEPAQSQPARVYPFSHKREFE